MFRLSEGILGVVGKRTDIVSLLQRETEGNLFFLVEVLRALAQMAGRLDAIGDIVLPQHVTTPSIEGLIHRRLSYVQVRYRALLEHAAIIGRQVDMQVIQELSQDVEVNRWLFACAETAILEIHDGSWRFIHDKEREGLLRLLSTAERVSLHQQAALAIERVYGESRASSLAFHWGEAGN